VADASLLSLPPAFRRTGDSFLRRTELHNVIHASVHLVNCLENGMGDTRKGNEIFTVPGTSAPNWSASYILSEKNSGLNILTLSLPAVTSDDSRIFQPSPQLSRPFPAYRAMRSGNKENPVTVLGLYDLDMPFVHGMFDSTSYQK